MQYLKQFFVILLFSFAGQLLQWLIPLPIPAAIYGFVLLFLALQTGLLREDRIQKAATFLIRLLPILFVAPAVNLLCYYKIIAPKLGAIVTIVVVSTLCVFSVAGLVTELLCKKGGEPDA